MPGPTHPPSTRTTLERALDEAIDRLTRAEPSSQTKALLIEARRLKGLMASWHAVPPPPDARREMLARVMRIAADAGSSATTLRPSAPVSIQPGPVSIQPAPITRPHSATGTTLPSVAAATGAGRGPLVVDTDGLTFLPSSSLAGVSAKLLHWDEAQGLFTALVQLDEGAELPEKRHVAVEELFVLDGCIRMGDDEVGPGGYVRADIGTEQPAIRADRGATLLFVGSERGEILG